MCLCVFGGQRSISVFIFQRPSTVFGDGGHLLAWNIAKKANQVNQQGLGT